MKKYISDGISTCWRDCLGCILEVEPERVPDFLKLYGANKYMDKTREWLREEWGKAMVCVHVNNFMETGKIRHNPIIGPDGYSIGMMGMITSGDNHAVICKDGVVFYDNDCERNHEYEGLMSYFIIYDLPKRYKKG